MSASRDGAPAGPEPEGPEPEGLAPAGPEPEGLAPAGPEPEGPEPEGLTSESPAPEGLEIVRTYVNTVDLEQGDDELADPDALREWLVAHDLLDDAAPSLTGRDLERAIALRETLRRLLAANHDRRPPDADDLETLNRLAAHVPVRVRFDRGTAAIVPAGGGLDRALGALLGLVAAAMADGSWERLKVCAEDSCRWAFYDASRNRSGRWCSMAVCGNRAKVRAYRERHERR